MQYGDDMDMIQHYAEAHEGRRQESMERISWYIEPTVVIGTGDDNRRDIIPINEKSNQHNTNSMHIQLEPKSIQCGYLKETSSRDDDFDVRWVSISMSSSTPHIPIPETWKQNRSDLDIIRQNVSFLAPTHHRMENPRRLIRYTLVLHIGTWYEMWKVSFDTTSNTANTERPILAVRTHEACKHAFHLSESRADGVSVGSWQAKNKARHGVGRGQKQTR